MNPELAALLTDGVASAREHPHLARALNSCAFRGELIRLLPGIYAAPDHDDRATRLQAVCAYRQSLVITRRDAAALTWWPEIECGEDIDVASPAEIKTGKGFRFEQRLIRPDLTTRRFGLNVTSPELTVLDLIVDLGASAIDESLRRRAVTLPRLRRALLLTPGRRGNRLRRELLEDSRDAPWSTLEREAHRMLRAAGLTGWSTNYRVDLGTDTFFLDIAIPAVRLGIELDGASYHDTDDAFHLDRRRDRALSRAGWQIIRFTAKSLDELVETIESLIHQRRRLLGKRSA